MNMQENLLHRLGAGVAGLLWLVLTADGLAAAPEDQVVRLERELLALAKSLGPPPEKSPEAPPQPVQAIVAAGDWEFSLEFAAKIGNEQSRANALIAILNNTSELQDRNQARAALGRVANIAGEIGNDAAKARVLADCAADCREAGRYGPGARPAHAGATFGGQDLR